MIKPPLYDDIHYITEEGEQILTTLASLLEESTYTVLYFYPKDNTPGCTTEAKDFSDMKKEFMTRNTQIIGVSKDSSRSHCSFQDKHRLQLGLISDTDTTLIQGFGARGEKKFMGKVYMGTMRNTYILDKNGTILQSRMEVSATGHAKEVLSYIKKELA